MFTVRHQNGSWVRGVDGVDLIVPPIMEPTTGPRQAATVGLDLADGNTVGVTDLTHIDDRVLNVPAWPRTETGHIQVVFDDFK